MGGLFPDLLSTMGGLFPLAISRKYFRSYNVVGLFLAFTKKGVIRHDLSLKNYDSY